jgi:hemerythrin-like metal-binding protein
MAIMSWSGKLSVGVERFDNEHKKLVEKLNGLHDELLRANAAGTMGTLLSDLVKYAQTHFLGEEAYFSEYHYPGALSHKIEHDAFRKKANDLEQAHRAGKTNLYLETLTFLKDWLTNHIMGTDMRYKDFFQSRGVK